MIIIKDYSDLQAQSALPLPHQRFLHRNLDHLHRCFAGEVRAIDDDTLSWHGYCPDLDGFQVYLEPGDELKPLSMITSTDSLLDCLNNGGVEGVEYDPASQCYQAVIVTNNSFALSVIVPDSPLDLRVRQHLDALASDY